MAIFLGVLKLETLRQQIFNIKFGLNNFKKHHSKYQRLLQKNLHLCLSTRLSTSPTIKLLHLYVPVTNLFM